MLTDKNLLIERDHPNLSGIQRIYRFPCGNGLSIVNSQELHYYPFAWEAAVLFDVSDDGDFERINYDTDLTDDVVVFFEDDEADNFISKAESYFAGLSNAN